MIQLRSMPRQYHLGTFSGGYSNQSDGEYAVGCRSRSRGRMVCTTGRGAPTRDDMSSPLGLSSFITPLPRIPLRVACPERSRRVLGCHHTPSGLIKVCHDERSEASVFCWLLQDLSPWKFSGDADKGRSLALQEGVDDKLKWVRAAKRCAFRAALHLRALSRQAG